MRRKNALTGKEEITQTRKFAFSYYSGRREHLKCKKPSI